MAEFPDVHAAVQDLIADGDRVIERTQTSATHTGEFNGISPTGKQVGWTEIHIYRLEDGKIAEQWSEIDLLGLLVQLGAIPGPQPDNRRGLARPIPAAGPGAADWGSIPR